MYHLLVEGRISFVVRSVHSGSIHAVAPASLSGSGARLLRTGTHQCTKGSYTQTQTDICLYTFAHVCIADMSKYRNCQIFFVVRVFQGILRYSPMGRLVEMYIGKRMQNMVEI